MSVVVIFETLVGYIERPPLGLMRGVFFTPQNMIRGVYSSKIVDYVTEDNS